MMTSIPLPSVRDLVLIGGGHAHALIVRKWGMDPMPGVRVTLINPDPVAPYTGMLPGHIAGHYNREDLMIDLVRLARFSGAQIVLDRAVGLDRDAGKVRLAGGRAIPYDICSVDIGIGSGLQDVPGFAEHGLAAKPLGDYAAGWSAFLARGLAFPRVVIIGAGVGGVELALATHHRLQGMGAKPQITLVDRGAEHLPALGHAARKALLRALQQAGIALIQNAAPARCDAQAVTLRDGRVLPADLILSVAGARPQAWLPETSLALQDGFIAVGATLQSSDPAIFAVGDCAHMTHAPRPKAGVFAVRQAPVLLHNLRVALGSGQIRRYQPQKEYLKLVSLGGKAALADRFGLTNLAGMAAGGTMLWRWKDRIDRAFMDKFAEYPSPPAPALPRNAAKGLADAMGAKPLCGGCGAKVGANDLTAALAGLPAPQRGDVVSGKGDDAAILRHGSGVQVITTDHLRAVTEDPSLMARIAATHALGDIWAMGAAPQAALAQVTLPRLSPQLQGRSLAQIMDAAAQVFAAAGADVVGGHTSIGSELSIGFTVTGLATRTIAKSGAMDGDAVILTKPLGSGTILAAEMAMARLPGLMLGEVWAACIATMLRPMGGASAVLSPHAHAMTDVTGFGLAGHLLEMLQASGMAARVHWPDVPLMAGAAALAAGGHASSLAPANRAAVDWQMTVPLGLDVALIHDPQTAGGLLAAVPQDQAMGLVKVLRAAGETAAVIGHLHSGAPHITITA